jgi:hypothetical protein
MKKKERVKMRNGRALFRPLNFTFKNTIMEWPKSFSKRSTKITTHS